MSRKRLTVLAIISSSLLTACSWGWFPVHRLDVNQGNKLDQESVDKLELGMTDTQVRFLLGNPLVTDSFHPDRWDYVYYYQEESRGKPIRKHLQVRFKEGKVVGIELPENLAELGKIKKGKDRNIDLDRDRDRDRDKDRESQ